MKHTMSTEDAINIATFMLAKHIVRSVIVSALVEDGFSVNKARLIVNWAQRIYALEVDSLKEIVESVLQEEEKPA